LCQINETCQKGLYQLTRGEMGIENHLSLEVISTEKVFEILYKDGYNRWISKCRISTAFT